VGPLRLSAFDLLAKTPLSDSDTGWLISTGPFMPMAVPSALHLW